MDNMEMELHVDIDFDLAKSEWRKNKKSIGQGMFKYTCKYVHHTGKICGKIVHSYLDNKYNYNFGGTYEDLYKQSLVDDPKIKKACKRHIKRHINRV